MACPAVEDAGAPKVVAGRYSSRVPLVHNCNCKGPGHTKLFPEKKKKKILTEGKFHTVRRVTQKFSDGYPSVSFFFFKNFCFFFFGGAADSFFLRCKINKKKDWKFEINTVR